MGFVYSLLNLFPDVVKWVLIISMFFPYYYWFWFNAKFINKKDLLFSLIWTIIIGATWVEYFKREVDVSLRTWLNNLPNEIYIYVDLNRIISGVTLLVVIAIFVNYFGSVDKSPGSIRYLS